MHWSVKKKNNLHRCVFLKKKERKTMRNNLLFFNNYKGLQGYCCFKLIFKVHIHCFYDVSNTVFVSFLVQFVPSFKHITQVFNLLKQTGVESINAHINIQIFYQICFFIEWPFPQSRAVIRQLGALWHSPYIAYDQSCYWFQARGNHEQSSPICQHQSHFSCLPLSVKSIANTCTTHVQS